MSTANRIKSRRLRKEIRARKDWLLAASIQETMDEHVGLRFEAAFKILTKNSPYAWMAIKSMAWVLFIVTSYFLYTAYQ